MRIFHRTKSATAVVIMKDGFRDCEERYVSDLAWRGVWVSDRPPHPTEVSGDALLTLEIPAHVFAEYEWLQDADADADRGSLIPATVLNRYGPAVAVRNDA